MNTMMRTIEDFSEDANDRTVLKVEIDNKIYCYKENCVNEIEKMLLVGEHDLIPKVIKYDISEGWLIKEWCNGKTLDQYSAWRDKSFWTKETIREFYQFSKSIFDFFHNRENPILVEDFKPRNICYDNSFKLFDLDCCAFVTEELGFKLGNKQYPFKSYESLSGFGKSPSDDYFSFANVIHNSLIRYPQWSNMYRDMVMSSKQFSSEYNEFVIKLQIELQNLKLKENEINFIVSCFHPLRKMRPNVFDWKK